MYFITSKHLNCHTHTQRSAIGFDSVFTFFDRSGCMFTLIWSNASNAAIFSNTTASSCICSSSRLLFFFPFHATQYVWSAVFKALVVAPDCNIDDLTLFSLLIFTTQQCHALSAVVGAQQQDHHNVNMWATVLQTPVLSYYNWLNLY